MFFADFFVLFDKGHSDFSWHLQITNLKKFVIYKLQVPLSFITINDKGTWLCNLQATEDHQLLF